MFRGGHSLFLTRNFIPAPDSPRDSGRTSFDHKNRRLEVHGVFFEATLDLEKFWASLINNHKATLAKYGLL